MIEVKGLSHRYERKGELAVRNISFEVNRGEVFGFLGPSGAGKSTTQKILIGLLSGFSGSVSVLGQDLASLDSDYYEHIGVSFELPNHYRKLSALENLRFFRSLYTVPTEEPLKLLRMVGLEDAANQRVGEFSKGMQMRLNFARSLLNRPKLLFLDEPTSGMDPGNAKAIKDIILDQKRRGTTIFLTTHNMTVADELCDRVAFIVKGEISLIGTPRDLKLRYGQKVARVEYVENGETKAKDFPVQGLGFNRDFLRLIQTHEVETIHTLEATLEDIFMQATGVRLL